MNYNVNWFNLLVANVPTNYRKVLRVKWLILLLFQVRKLHASILLYIQLKRYDLNHTGQVIYLEKVLNDSFDPIDRRIFISDGNFADRVFLYHRPQATQVLFYHRWKEFEDYDPGSKIQWDFKIWEADAVNGASDGPPPNYPNQWTEVGVHTKVKYRSEYRYGTGFIVNLPASLQYNESRLQATIDFYRVAGRFYVLQTF